MAYLSLFFQKFASLARKQVLVDSIIKAVALTRKHDQLIAKFRDSASMLRTWVLDNTAKWSAGDASTSTAEIKDKMAELQEVRGTCCSALGRWRG